MAKRTVNIKDVAAKADVHPSTVSRVLNPETRSMVSEAVADRVTRIANEMGYARSTLAYGLRTGRTHTVGVLIPDLTNPMFPPIIRRIERTLAQQGYIAILADSDNNQKNETTIVESLKSRNVDGLILATAHRLDSVVSNCVEEHIPLVLVNRTIDAHSVTAVINDDEHGIELAHTLRYAVVQAVCYIIYLLHGFEEATKLYPVVFKGLCYERFDDYKAEIMKRNPEKKVA